MSEPRDNHLAADKAAGRPPADSLPTLTDRVRSLRLPPQLAAGRARSSVVPWVLCGLLLLTSIAFGYRAFTAGAGTSGNKAPGTAGPTSGETEAVAGSGDVVLESKGYIIPAHQIQVSPKVSGMIEEMHFEEGQHVKKGEILAELEDVEYRADRAHAEAAVAEARRTLAELQLYRPREIDQAKARWDEADVQARQLDLDSQRSRRLRVGNALADRDLEQAESAFRSMQEHARALKMDYELLKKGPRDERIAVAEARIKQAEADFNKANWRWEQCKVVAPTSGTILSKKAEKGNIVNPIAFNISASLCDMADLSDLEVDLSIQERDVAQVVKRQKCRIVPEAFQDRHYEGVVSRLMPTADRAKGAIPVRVKVKVPQDEEGVFLKPDMSVIVSFLKVEKGAAKEDTK